MGGWHGVEWVAHHGGHTTTRAWRKTQGKVRVLATALSLYCHPKALPSPRPFPPSSSRFRAQDTHSTTRSLCLRMHTQCPLRHHFVGATAQAQLDPNWCFGWHLSAETTVRQRRRPPPGPIVTPPTQWQLVACARCNGAKQMAHPRISASLSTPLPAQECRGTPPVGAARLSPPDCTARNGSVIRDRRRGPAASGLGSSILPLMAMGTSEWTGNCVGWVGRRNADSFGEQTDMQTCRFWLWRGFFACAQGGQVVARKRRVGKCRRKISFVNCQAGQRHNRI